MAEKIQNTEKVPSFERINSMQRLILCLAIGAIVYFIVRGNAFDKLTHLMIGWDTFSVCMIVISWLTFYNTGYENIRKLYKIQDSSRAIIFIIILISTMASFLAVLLLIITKKEGDTDALWRLPISILGMLFSWILIHTIFAFRYAHIYYGNHKSKPNTDAGGLEFPGDTKPDYLDFAYFSFVLGMTFQVSDVQITSQRLRRMAMFHGLISFGFNTIMIALTINLIAGYGG